MLLAAVTVYLHAVASEGLPTARRQAAIVLLASTVVEWIGTRTGFPFGPVRVHGKLRPADRRGGADGDPARVAGGRALRTQRGAGVASDRRTVWRPASASPSSAMLTDLNLEPVAWHVREYWLWYPAPAPAPARLAAAAKLRRVVRPELRARARCCPPITPCASRRPGASAPDPRACAC